MEFDFRRIRSLLSSIRLIPHIVLLLGLSPEHVLLADMTRWAELLDLAAPRTRFGYVTTLVVLMTFKPEFRNLFYLRLGWKAKLFGFLCPRLATLEINPTDIGPGFFIQHGIGTLISADKIGRNCWVNQNVTIGFSNKTDRPTIGDDVRISAGAAIVGKVKVGDNVTVGLNSVVIENVPSDVTVLGVPAVIVWSKPQRTEAARQ